MKRTIGILSLVFAMTITAFGQTLMTQAPKAEKLSKQQLSFFVANARTASEHRRIAQYYDSNAQRYLAESKEHAQMAEQFKKNTTTSSSKYVTGTVNHCAYFAQSLKDKAAKMQKLAQLHEQMAKDADRT